MKWFSKFDNKNKLDENMWKNDIRRRRFSNDDLWISIWFALMDYIGWHKQITIYLSCKFIFFGWTFQNIYPVNAIELLDNEMGGVQFCMGFSL